MVWSCWDEELRWIITAERRVQYPAENTAFFISPERPVVEAKANVDLMSALKQIPETVKQLCPGLGKQIARETAGRLPELVT